MRIITKRRLTDFYQKHASAKGSLLAWHKNTSAATWQNLVELKQAFPSADLVNNFTVFNIGGNKYRLIVYVDYEDAIVFIRHILTHAEYDKDNWKDDDWYGS
jgi:mRNA interferase HigB